jgi:hypothetical protein
MSVSSLSTPVASSGLLACPSNANYYLQCYVDVFVCHHNQIVNVVGTSYKVEYDVKYPLAKAPGIVLNASCMFVTIFYDASPVTNLLLIHFNGIANPTKTFSPLKIRELELRNRLVVAPMCQYSSTDGFMNDHHFRHYTTFGVGGAGLVIFEGSGNHQNLSTLVHSCPLCP